MSQRDRKLLKAAIERNQAPFNNSIGTTQVGPNGEITPIKKAVSMVQKYFMFNENDPHFRWPLKGEKVVVVEGNVELEQKYIMFDEHDPGFTWPLKVK
jgi:hypothetical protein